MPKAGSWPNGVPVAARRYLCLWTTLCCQAYEHWRQESPHSLDHRHRLCCNAAAPPAVARDLSQAADVAKEHDLRRRPSQTARRFQQGGGQQSGGAPSSDAQRLAAEAAADAASQAGPAGWLPAAVNLPAAVRRAAPALARPGSPALTLMGQQDYERLHPSACNVVHRSAAISKEQHTQDVAKQTSPRIVQPHIPALHLHVVVGGKTLPIKRCRFGRRSRSTAPSARSYTSRASACRCWRRPPAGAQHIVPGRRTPLATGA